MASPSGAEPTTTTSATVSFNPRRLSHSKFPTISLTSPPTPLAVTTHASYLSSVHSHGEAGDGEGVPRVQPGRRRRRRGGAQPVGVHQRRSVRLLGGAPRRRLRGPAPAVGRVQQAGPRRGRARPRRRAGRQPARPPGARRRRRLPARDGGERLPARSRRACRPRRAEHRHRAHPRRRHLLRDSEGERVPARPSEARPEHAHSRSGAVVPWFHSQHLPGLRACQRARPTPAEERPDPVPSWEHALPHRRRHQPAPWSRPLLHLAGEDLGVAGPVGQPPLPRRRRAEPAQGVQDAADGRPGTREAARRRAGATVHGEGGQGAPHPGARRPEGRPGHAPAAAAGLLQGRPRQQRQLAYMAMANPPWNWE